MAGVNKIILIGNLEADPEVRYTPSGTAVANFNMATEEQWTDREGQKANSKKDGIGLWHGDDLEKFAGNTCGRGVSVL